MKKLIAFVLTIIALALTSCQEEPYLTVNPSSISFDQNGGTQTMKISANYPWTATVTGSGFSVSPTSGTGEATVSVTANPATGPDAVTGSITVSSEGLSSTVNLSQDAKSILTVGQGVTVPAEGGNYTVDIQYNVDVKVTVDPSASSWLKFVQTKALNSGKLEFQIAANTSADFRTGKVTVSDAAGKAAPVDVVFTQEARNTIKVGQVSRINAAGGSLKVPVQYNTEYNVSIESAAQNWIKCVKTKAMTNGEIEFSISVNETTEERSGKVTLTDVEGKADKVEFTIVQDAKKVIIVGQPNVVEAEGGTYELDVQYNTEYKITVAPSASNWIKYVETKALSSGKLVFQIAENESPSERSGKVTVEDVTSEVSPFEIVFVQKGMVYEIKVGEIPEFPSNAGYVDIKVEHNVDLRVEIDNQEFDYWAACSDISDGTIRIYASQNFYPDRTATLMLYDSKNRVEPVRVEIKQSESDVRKGLITLYNEMDGNNWFHQQNWCSNVRFDLWEGVAAYLPDNVLEVHLRLNNHGLKGQIPDCFDLFGDALVAFEINEREMYDFYDGKVPELLTGTLPDSFFRLKKLQYIDLCFMSLTSIPDKFSEMTSLLSFYCQQSPYIQGPLPTSLGSLPNINYICIGGTQMTGSIPESWCKPTVKLYLGGNCLSGQLPRAFMNVDDAKNSFWSTVSQRQGYGFDLGNLPAIPGNYPENEQTEYDGSKFTFDEVIKNNKYTVQLYWATWCPFSKGLMPQLKDFYDKYHSEGLEIIAMAPGEDGADWETKDASALKEIKAKGYDKWYNIKMSETVIYSFPASVPVACVYDSHGNVVFHYIEGHDPYYNRFNKTASTDLIPFLESVFGPLEESDNYSSTDYSKNGDIMTLQKASKGQGINLVLMGDGFTDRDMKAGGRYERLMESAAEEFFAIEPYKSFRDRFNVYAVKAVSKHGNIGEKYETVFDTYLGNGTYIGGNTERAYLYAQQVPSINSINNLLVVVLCNAAANSGTCYMYEGTQSAVAFLTTQRDRCEYYGPTLRHEAGGHGFGFLADEYVTMSSKIPDSLVKSYTGQWEKYGWWANVDFTDNSSAVKWAKFLSIPEYSNEVGVYEGAFSYAYGTYKPTKNSMMNENLEYFNAPSREAIYKRIMKLSGETYSFDKFLQYDEINRVSAARSAARPPLKAAANGADRGWQPTAPPVILP